MVKQYPYTLQKLNISESTQDENGDLSTPSEAWVNVCKCRSEDAKQKRFNNEDGSFTLSSFLIQCPIGTSGLKANDQIKILNTDNSIRLQGMVIYSDEGQLHTRIWV